MAERLVKDPDQLVATIEASFPYPDQMERYYGLTCSGSRSPCPNTWRRNWLTPPSNRPSSKPGKEQPRKPAKRSVMTSESFVADCVASLREQTAQLCEDMLSSINGCETGVHQKTLNRLVRFIDQFKSMNFANDRVMEAAIGGREKGAADQNRRGISRLQQLPELD